jgi:undecaprenyl pyrophosphate synthase
MRRRKRRRRTGRRRRRSSSRLLLKHCECYFMSSDNRKSPVRDVSHVKTLSKDYMIPQLTYGRTTGLNH